MTNDYLVKKVFKQYLLASVIMLVSATVSMTIDSILAGQLIGGAALGVMSLVQPLFMALAMIGSILSSGGSILSAQAIGSNDMEKMSHLFTLCMGLGAVIGTLVTLCAFIIPGGIANALGATDPELHRMTVDYIHGLAPGGIPIVLSLVVMAFARVDGSPQLSMAAAVSMSAVNVALDVLFGGVLKMGTFGLGLATSLGYLTAVLVACLHFLKKESNLRLRLPRKILEQVRRILVFGFPGALSSGLTAVQSILINHLLFGLGGAVALSALAVQSGERALLNPVAAGVGHTITPIIGVFFGERDGRAVHDTIRISVRVCLVFSLVVIAALFFLCRPIVMLFNPGSEQVADMAVFAIRLFLIGLPVNALNNLFIHYYQSIGKLWLSNVISVCRLLIYNLLFAFSFSPLLGTNAVWGGFLATEILTLITLCAIVCVLRRRPARGIDDFLLLPEDCYANVPTLEVSIQNSMADVVGISERIQAFCLENGVDGRRAYFTALCVEEMAGNVVRHGFSDDKQHFLDIKVAVNGDEISFRLRDDGLAFNPLEVEEAKPDDADAQAGNIGIRMVKRLYKQADYRFTSRLNNLFVIV